MGPAFNFLRWFKLAHICIQVTRLNTHGRLQKCFLGGQGRYFAYTFQVANEAMQIDFHKTFYPFYQACSQVFRFMGEEYFLVGQDLCFYFMSETNFTGHKDIWYGTGPEYHPETMGLLSTP